MRHIHTWPTPGFLLTALAGASCPDGWEEHDDLKTCYYFEASLQLPMHEADSYCQQLYGSHLASVLDSHEMGYVRSKSNNKEFWIGLLQKADDPQDNINAFQWMDGSSNSGFNQFRTGYSYGK